MSSILKRIADTLFPQACVLCTRCLLGGEKLICSDCIQDFSPTDMHLIPPMSELTEEEKAAPGIMMERLWGWARLERAVAAYFYQQETMLSDAVGAMKYYHRQDVGRFLSRLMAEEVDAANTFSDIDAIIPVPLHPQREHERGYNQALLLAEGVAEALGKPILNDAVIRVKYQGNQARMSHEQRAENIRNAFTILHPEHITSVAKNASTPPHILIIDDVLTTGATIGTLCETLQKELDIKLSALTLAVAR